jgi:site-specific recombinase XerD
MVTSALLAVQPLQSVDSRRRIQELFRFYATEADLPADRRHVHVLRHSAAVHVLDAGRDWIDRCPR